MKLFSAVLCLAVATCGQVNGEGLRKLEDPPANPPPPHLEPAICVPASKAGKCANDAAAEHVECGEEKCRYPSLCHAEEAGYTDPDTCKVTTAPLGPGHDGPAHDHDGPGHDGPGHDGKPKPHEHCDPEGDEDCHPPPPPKPHCDPEGDEDCPEPPKPHEHPPCDPEKEEDCPHPPKPHEKKEEEKEPSMGSTSSNATNTNNSMQESTSAASAVGAIGALAIAIASAFLV